MRTLRIPRVGSAWTERRGHVWPLEVLVTFITVSNGSLLFQWGVEPNKLGFANSLRARDNSDL